MHRVDTAGNVAGLFGPGNPGAGIGPTLLGHEWFNDVQENLVTLITGAGIALVKGDYTQVDNAVRTLAYYYASIAQTAAVAAAATDATNKVNALAAHNIGVGGLATGGGDLSADRTITVLAASDAETKALGTAAKAVTPAGLAALFAGVVAASSSLLLPRGLIIKTGTTAVLTGDTAGNVVAFDDPFPTACDKVFLTHLGSSAINSGGSVYGWSVTNKSAASFTMTTDCPAGAFDYLAFGR